MKKKQLYKKPILSKHGDLKTITKGGTSGNPDSFGPAYPEPS
jgi:hypothetical protein